MNKIELLAPAGNLEKAKIALLYGADAVYVGGKQFSLRARASNFTLPDLEELCRFAKSSSKKIYVTMNIIPHDEDFVGLDDYLIQLEQLGVTGIITSSLYIIKKVRHLTPQLECHISTQTSIANSASLAFYEKLGAKRAVLARELNVKQIEQIQKKTKLELEVFIHGGMCSSYSGRCVLSNHMTGRDANRGGCAHSCRWNYILQRKFNKNSYSKHYFNMGSKDLMAIRIVPRLIEMGINSLKIEGRMKSAYYLATVVRCYRMLIDHYLSKGYPSEEEFKLYEAEIAKAENRLTSDGFFRGIPTCAGQLYDPKLEQPTKEYVGYVKDYDFDTKIAVIEQRNYFEVGAKLEFFGPQLSNTTLTIEKMYDYESGEELLVARHPLQLIKMIVPFAISPHDMIRLKKT